MNSITADELDLMTFFESDPQLSDQNEPWVYNDAVYIYSNNTATISFAISPSYKDVRIIHKIGNDIVFELNAMNVIDVIYKIDQATNEWLTIKVLENNEIIIKLKPSIQISQSYTSST